VAQERADQLASVLTSIFLILGLFSIVTGLMLVALVFALLTASRRSELAILRTLGARRRDVSLVLLGEGAAYALGGALVGTVAGLALSQLLVRWLHEALTPVGLALRAHVAPSSVMLAFASGLLISLVTIGVAAAWTGRLNIVAAVRGEAVPGDGTARWLAPLGAAVLACLGVGAVVIGARGASLLPICLGLSGSIIAVACVLRWWLRAPGRRRENWRIQGAHRLQSLAPLLTLAVWILPRDLVSRWGLPLPAPTPEYFPVAGTAITLSLAWAFALHLGALLALGVTLLRPLRPLWLAGWLASAYLRQSGVRSGMTIAMFGIVLCSLTLASVLLAGARDAFGPLPSDNVGYDLRARVSLAPPGDATDGRNGVAPLADLRGALRDAPATGPDDFPAMGLVRAQSAELIRLHGMRASWQPSRLSVVDDEFLRDGRARLQARSRAFADDHAVWQALAERPDLAVASTGLASRLGIDASRLNGQEPDSVVWVRAMDGGRPARVQVVAVLPPRTALEEGLVVSSGTAALAAMPPPPEATFYLRTRNGLSPERAVAALNFSFGERGLQASLIDGEARLAQAVQTPLRFLLQGFLAVGLVSGVLAVALLGTRAALERRAQIGVLRTVGWRAGSVQFSFLIEGSTIAVAGILVGLGAGVLLAGEVVGFLRQFSPGFPLVVPVDQIALSATLTWGAALIAAAVPAWRAGTLSPIEASRLA
jgi:cell division protein FtsX